MWEVPAVSVLPPREWVSPANTSETVCVCGLRRTLCQGNLKCVVISKDWLLLPQLSLGDTLHTSYLPPLRQRHGWEGSSKQWLPGVSKTSECEKTNCKLKKKSTQTLPPPPAQTSGTNKQKKLKKWKHQHSKPSPFWNETHCENTAQGDTWWSEQQKGLTKMDLIHPPVPKQVQPLLILTDAFLISFKIPSDRVLKIITSLFLLSDYITLPTGKQQTNMLQTQ